MLTPFFCGVISAEKGSGSNINRVSERTTGGCRIKDLLFSFFSRQLMAKTANITQKRDIFTGKSDFFTCLSLTFKAKHFLTENVVIAITLLSKQRCYPGDDICNVKHPMYGRIYV
ncbi:TPA: hypothetical protein LLS58_002668 [Klebsiella michiganensis]|nr:hypothetical protein [Klebsiella michiganensis]